MPENNSIRVMGFLTEAERDKNENGRLLGEVTRMSEFEALAEQSTGFFMKYLDAQGNDLDWNGVARHFSSEVPSWIFTKLSDGGYDF